jgi:hypothetical protein
MRLKRIYLIFPPIIIFLLVVSIHFYKEYSTRSKFLDSCIELRGKDLTLENLNSLNGKVRVYTSPGPATLYWEDITQEYIEQYLLYLEKKPINASKKVSIVEDGAKKMLLITIPRSDNTAVECYITMTRDNKIFTQPSGLPHGLPFTKYWD